MPRTYAKGRKRRFQGNQHTLTQMSRAARGNTEPELIPESTPESISSCKSDHSQELFSSSSTTSSPTNSDIDSELSSEEDSFENKTTSSSRKKLVLAKETLSTRVHQEDSGSTCSQDAVSGFRFIDLAQLAGLVEQLVCPQCHSSGLTRRISVSAKVYALGLISFVLFVSSGLAFIPPYSMGHLWR